MATGKLTVAGKETLCSFARELSIEFLDDDTLVAITFSPSVENEHRFIVFLMQSDPWIQLKSIRPREGGVYRADFEVAF